MLIIASSNGTINTLSDIEAETLSMYCDKIVAGETSNNEYRHMKAQLLIRSKEYEKAVSLIG